MKAKISLLPGDGIGPDVVGAARTVLEAVASGFGHDFSFEEHPIGGISIDEHGAALTDETLEACRAADAVLLGAVGGPQWDDPSASVRPEQGLLGLRKELGLFANLRPIKPFPSLLEASPLKPERLEGVDLLVVRELTGGIYFGTPREQRQINGDTQAVDTMLYSQHEVRRVAHLAFQAARERKGRVSSVDKANVLECSRLWRQTVAEVARQYPEVILEHFLVDAAAMRLITHPAMFDVIVTGNMFGDILTDEASVLTGSIGTLPSASIGKGRPGLFEPVHGSAPDIVGKGIANPVGTILSAAMLLRHSLKLEAEARAVEQSVERALLDGFRTADLAGNGRKAHSTEEMTAAILERILY